MYFGLFTDKAASTTNECAEKIFRSLMFWGVDLIDRYIISPIIAGTAADSSTQTQMLARNGAQTQPRLQCVNYVLKGQKKS